MKFNSICVILFLALGPIYWVGPYVGYRGLLLAKLCCLSLFIYTFFNELVRKKQRFMFPPIFNGTSWLIITVCILISSLFSNDIGVAISNIVNITIGFGMIWIMYNWSFLYDSFEENAWIAGGIVFCLSFLIITNSLLNFPDWMNPYYPDGYGLATLAYTGFGSSRTIWSDGVSMLFPLMIIGGYQILKGKPILVFFILVVYFLAVLIPGGRTGILSVFITSLIALRIYLPKNNKGNAALVFILLLGMFSLYLLGGDTRLITSFTESDGLHELTTGRTEGYIIGLTIIANNPIWGAGPGGANLHDYGHYMSESIHNYWIGLAAESGLIVTVFFFSLFISLFIKYQKVRSKFSVEETSHIYVVIAGLLLSLFQPGGFIGSFQQCSVFWICLGRLLFLMQKYRVDKIKA